MNYLVSHRALGFARAPLHKRKEPHAFRFIVQRAPFWVALFSLLAFVAGNIIGQHGLQVFWKSLGREDDSLIVYTGTVTPIAKVPDYSRWLRYGGNAEDNTFRQVPQDDLTTLPVYPGRRGTLPSIYSVGYLGSYSSGEEGTGSHPAVDIRVPIGTPIRSIANGVVSSVRDDGSGYGKLIVIRHPNVPDPSNPSQKTVLFSCYAHLSAFMVAEGDVVQKGETIGLSGATGDVSGPHLHFQIDRDTAPWHPYWPFTGSEIRSAGLTTNAAINSGFKSDNVVTYTVNPLLYVQADYSPTTLVVHAAASEAASSVPRVASVKLTAQQLTAQRKAARLASLQKNATTVAVATSTSSASTESATTVVQRQVVVSRTEVAMATGSPVATVSFTHNGSYSGRGWVRVFLTLLDAQGNVVVNPVLDRDIALRAAFGSADFNPSTLSALDFQNGRAEINVLPHGSRTLIIQAMPYGTMSQPMKYEK